MKRIFTCAMIALTLAAAGCARDTSQLVENLESDNSSARRNATTKLAIMNKDPETLQKIAALLDSDNERTVLIATQILGTSDSTMIKPLTRVLHHPNEYIRDRAVEAIALIGYLDAAPYVIEALQDSSELVRNTAVKMLGQIGDSDVLPSLFSMLRDDADSIRAQAVQSIYMYHDDPTAIINASDFAVAMNDPSDQVRYVAAQALGAKYNDGDIAGELLIEALGDPNKYVRIKAIQSLATLKYEPAVQPLKDMYETSTVDEEIEISDAIKQISGEDFPLGL